MTIKSLQLSYEDMDGNQDTTAEISIEYLENSEVIFAVMVSASGQYDEVTSMGDANGDGNFDKKDKKIYVDLANAFAKIKL